ncbi:hypothetical protein F7U66_00305 [Vibrio parahaemolyticus]|nr:hypothetical protein [Vibrio parahaemolyticus]
MGKVKFVSYAVNAVILGLCSYFFPVLSPLVFVLAFAAVIYLPQLICRGAFPHMRSRVSYSRISKPMIYWFALFFMVGVFRYVGYVESATIDGMRMSSATDRGVIWALELMIVALLCFNVLMYSVRASLGAFYEVMTGDGDFMRPDSRVLIDMVPYVSTTMGFSAVSSVCLAYGASLGAPVLPMMIFLLYIMNIVSVGIIVRQSGVALYR